MKLAINLSWSNNNIWNDYKLWIDECFQLDIKLVRIFCSRWSINCLYDKSYTDILQKIIKYAEIKSIDICLVITNFIDFNNSNYNDLSDNCYSWQTNKYNRNKSNKKFFRNIDYEFKNEIKSILKSLYNNKNVKYIEIMNEIDQVRCNKKTLAKWANKILEYLINEFQQRYIFTFSISNHKCYEYFKKQINTFVDLHCYSFPYESAVLNIEYCIRKNHFSPLYLGEYAKNSDSGFLEDINSKIYFTSGIWGSYIYKLEFIPMSWWWKEILESKEYKKILDIYKKEMKKLQNEQIRTTKIRIQYEIIGIETNDISNREKNKIKDRIKNLLFHPSYVFRETKNIKKYLLKKLNKIEPLILYEINSQNERIYYLESYQKVTIETCFMRDSEYELLDLITGNIKNVLKGDKLIILGCYLLKKTR